jgi:hypothetical protein
MVRLEEWMEILDLPRQGLSISEIARRTGRSRPRVRRQLRQSGPQPRRRRDSPPSPLEPYRTWPCHADDQSPLEVGARLASAARSARGGPASARTARGTAGGEQDGTAHVRNTGPTDAASPQEAFYQSARQWRRREHRPSLEPRSAWAHAGRARPAREQQPKCQPAGPAPPG